MKLFSSISKITGLIFQIIIVILLVLVFSYFDPFDILAPTKTKLKNTPIQVQSIREIGQLITAEYYGEVIASLDEVLAAEFAVSTETFNSEIDALHADFVASIDSLALRDLKKKNIYTIYVQEYEDIRSDPAFGQYAYFISEKLRDRNYKPKEIKKELEDEKIKELIGDLCLKRKEQLRRELHDISTSEIQSAFAKKEEHRIDKALKQRRLVLLGRGWVKAGFDFINFSDKNFIYDKDNHKAVMIGLKPQIISATINPWFIPEEGVEGFEFMVVERGLKHNPEWTIRVKQKCLDKLMEQAQNKQILLQAQKNAEGHLKNFFSLLLNDEEFTGVFFYNSYLDYSLDALVKDSIIRNEEILSVDTILRTALKSGDLYTGEDFTQFLDSLKHSEVEIHGVAVTLNSKSSLLFNIMKDGRIDSTDTALYFKYLPVIGTSDSIWFSHSGKTQPDSSKLAQSIEEFNADLDKLKTKFKI